jgi:hypothetical protein
MVMVVTLVFLVFCIGVTIHLLQQGDLSWICAIHMVEPTLEMSTIVMGVFGGVIYLLHDLFWIIACIVSGVTRLGQGCGCIAGKKLRK